MAILGIVRHSIIGSGGIVSTDDSSSWGNYVLTLLSRSHVEEVWNSFDNLERIDFTEGDHTVSINYMYDQEHVMQKVISLTLSEAPEGVPNTKTFRYDDVDVERRVGFDLSIVE